MDDSMIGEFITEQPMDEPMEMGIKPMPMLRRFVDYGKPIRYLKQLGAGAEGTVHRVIIEGREYALKLMSHYNTLTAFSEQPLIAYGYLQIFASLFSHECRAFARLQSIGEDGTWAVKCHGWMKLSDKQQRPIVRKTSLIDPGRWAIIKDYLPNPVQLSDCQELARKKDVFRRALIYTNDIKPSNFQGSFIVDLGSAKTYPYITRFWSEIEFDRVWDNYDFNVTDWEIDEETGVVVFAGTNAQRREDQKHAALIRTAAKFDPKLGYDVLPEGWDKE